MLQTRPGRQVAQAHRERAAVKEWNPGPIYTRLGSFGGARVEASSFPGLHKLPVPTHHVAAASVKLVDYQIDSGVNRARTGRQYRKYCVVCLIQGLPATRESRKPG